MGGYGSLAIHLLDPPQLCRRAAASLYGLGPAVLAAWSGPGHIGRKRLLLPPLLPNARQIGTPAGWLCWHFVIRNFLRVSEDIVLKRRLLHHVISMLWEDFLLTYRLYGVAIGDCFNLLDIGKARIGFQVFITESNRKCQRSCIFV